MINNPEQTRDGRSAEHQKPWLLARQRPECAYPSEPDARSEDQASVLNIAQNYDRLAEQAEAVVGSTKPPI
jgi:hypothetical protein